MLGKSLTPPGSTAPALVGLYITLLLCACTPQQETTLLNFQHHELQPLLPAIRKILPENIAFESAGNQLIIFASTEELTLYLPTLAALDRPPAQYQFEWRSYRGDAHNLRYSTDVTVPPGAMRLTENQTGRWMNILWGRQLENSEVRVQYLSPEQSQLEIYRLHNDPGTLHEQALSFSLPHNQWQRLNPAPQQGFTTAQNGVELEIRLLLLPANKAVEE